MATAYQLDALQNLTAVSLNASTLSGNPYGYTGRRYDTETQLWYYRNRMYSASLGRFLQRDPARFVDGYNIYAYVQNRPVIFFDPTGLAHGFYINFGSSSGSNYGSNSYSGQSFSNFLNTSSSSSSGSQFSNADIFGSPPGTGSSRGFGNGTSQRRKNSRWISPKKARRGRIKAAKLAAKKALIASNAKKATIANRNKFHKDLRPAPYNIANQTLSGDVRINEWVRDLGSGYSASESLLYGGAHRDSSYVSPAGIGSDNRSWLQIRIGDLSGFAWQGKIWLTEDPMVNGRSLAVVPDSFERRVYHRVVKQIARGTLQWGQGLYQAISHPVDTISSIASSLFQVIAHPVNAYGRVRQSLAEYQNSSAIEQSDAMVGFVTRGTLDYALFKAGSVAFNRLQQARLLAAEGSAAGVEVAYFGKRFQVTKSGFRVSRHGLDRKLERGVRSIDELDALKNPLKIGDIQKDSMGRLSKRYYGRKAQVVINPETGKIISVNPTSTRRLNKLLRGQ